MLKDLAISYFRDFYSLNSDSNGEFILEAFPRLSAMSLRELSKSYSKEEICYDIKGMEDWKAPGPDGLQAAFYQRAWSVVGDSVSTSIIEILEVAKFSKGMDDALIVLIPKTEQLESIRQFHPISLCNVTFKLVTKVLVYRPQLIMEDIVSPNQSSFASLTNN